MRRQISLLSVAAVLVVVAATTRLHAEDAPPATEAPATTTSTLPPTQYETTSAGDPGLEPGRWLVLADLNLNGRRRTVLNFWVLTKGPDGLQLTELFVDPPPAVAADVKKVTGTGVIWTPTEADLAALDEHWSEMKDMGRGITSVKSELWGPAAYDDDIKKEEKTKNAIWVVRQTYQFEHGASRPIRQVNIYGALTPDGSGFTGNFSAVAVAAAPFPIPIPYNGTFRMIRIGHPPSKGLLARLADLFAGCGR